MRTEQEQKELKETRESLERMHGFDVSTLPRESDLGKQFSFREAVEPARRLTDLYKRLTLTALEDFPTPLLQQIRNRANSDYQLFTQILQFDPNQPNAQAARQNLIQNITNQYNSAFTVLNPLISYSLYRSADFQRLDQEARATLQEIRDKANDAMQGLSKSGDVAKQILEEIRNVAAERGVGQQAFYFREASKEHADEASKWQRWTVKVGVGLALYAFATLFIHKWQWLRPVLIRS